MTTTRAAPPCLKIGIAGALAGMFLGMMDSYIVATALPSIVGDLGGLASMSWIITAYALAIAASTQVWGKLSDLYDRRTMFLLSVAVFLTGSMLCGLARSMGELIAFRAVQGIGAGGLLVGAMAMIQALLPPRESTRVSSWTGLLLGVALIAGPLVGGVITSGLSWRWIFYVNVPFGLICLLGTLAGVSATARPPTARVKIDFPGTALLTTAVVGLTLVTGWAGTTYAWNSPLILGLGTAVVVATAAFIHVERRAPEPLVPFRMFGTRNFALAQILGFAFNVTMVATVNFLPQYFQNARGVDPARSGFLLIPMMAGMVVVMNRSSAYIRRTGRYRILPIIGGAGVVTGMLLLLTFGPHTNPLLASLAGIPLGVGLGCLIQNTILIIRMSVEPRDIGAAMGMGSLTRTMGSGIGAAVFGALYLGAVTDRLGSATSVDPERLGSLPPEVRAAWSAAVTDGLHAVAIGAAAAGVIALIAACLVREVPLGSR